MGSPYIEPGPHVDHVCSAADLSHFALMSWSISTIRTSWHRVLAPRGRLFISVLGLDALAALFLDTRGLSTNERFQVMRMIFGGRDAGLLTKYGAARPP